VTIPTKGVPPEYRDPQAALACGQAFQRVAQQFIPDIPHMEGTGQAGFSSDTADLVACATNLAFAIELYLKGLLAHLGLQVPATHDLRQLYDRIPSPIRALMEDVYLSCFREQVEGRPRPAVTLTIGPPDEPVWDRESKGSPALPDLLTRSRDLFQSWRYVFEYRPRDESPYHLRKFEHALLWCAAETVKAELGVRLFPTEDSP